MQSMGMGGQMQNPGSGMGQMQVNMGMGPYVPPPNAPKMMTAADFVPGKYEGNLKILPNGVVFVSNPQVRQMFGKDIFVDREDVKYFGLLPGDIVRVYVNQPPEGRPQGVNPEIV